MKTFRQYTAAQAEEHNLFPFMLDTLIDNLQYLYDKPMDTPENRAAWMQATRKNEFWRAVVAFEDGTPCGFMTYQLSDGVLYIASIQIRREHRMSPSLLRGLLACCFQSEQGRYKQVYAHINKQNMESQKNFLRFGKIVGDTGNSYKIEITDAGWKMIDRLCKPGV